MEFVAFCTGPVNTTKTILYSIVISGLLSGGRTSVMYRDLVRDKEAGPLMRARSRNFPAVNHPSLFFFYLIPGLGHTAAENEKELDTIIADLQKQKVDEAALARVKTKTRAGFIRQLDDNAGLAQLLASYYADFGDWKKVFTSLDEIDHVTADDVQRVARQYFTPENRTVALTIEPTAAEGGK